MKKVLPIPGKDFKVEAHTHRQLTNDDELAWGRLSKSRQKEHVTVRKSPTVFSQAGQSPSKQTVPPTVSPR